MNGSSAYYYLLLPSSMVQHVVGIPQQASDCGRGQRSLDSAPPVAQDIERSRDVPELMSKL